MTFFKKVCRIAAHFVCAAIMLETVTPAMAQTGPNEIMLRGDIRITRNDAGSIIANIPAGQTANEMYSMSGNSPIIWGRYYPANKSGTIQVSFMRRNINSPSCNPTSPETCGVEMRTVELSPAMGSRFQDSNGIKKLFDGVNPFEAFKDPAGSPIYKNITLGAFEAAMGMWAKTYSTSRGYVAVADQNFQGVFNWDECSKKVLGACVRRRYHTEAYATVKPKWFVMTTVERAQGRGAIPIYRARGCTSSDISCGVTGGMSFIPVSEQSDFPSVEEKLWHQHQWKDSWTVMAFVLVIATIVSAGTFLLAGGPILFASALGGIGANSLAAVAIVEGVGFGLSYAVLSYTMNGGNGSIGDAQNGFFGGLSDGSITPDPSGSSDWSPVRCVESGTGPHAAANGRHGNQECTNWLSSDLSTAPTGIGTFFNQRNVEVNRDWSLTNDVKAMRDAGGVPTRLGGIPDRQ